jgi:hypothetical protein
MTAEPTRRAIFARAIHIERSALPAYEIRSRYESRLLSASRGGDSIVCWYVSILELGGALVSGTQIRSYIFF